MKGIPSLTSQENRRYAKLRKLLIKANRQKTGDYVMANKKAEVQTMCVAAMAHTLEETIGVDVSNATAKHGNNFVRLTENTLKTKQFNAREKRRKTAKARLNEIRNS
jgi:hypothetical protein